MSKHLLSAFAADDPGLFAQLLGASDDVAEAIAVLSDIPDGLEGEVVARLTPEAADRLLNELPDPVVIGWLGTCTASTGRRLLSRINRERADRLVAGISNRSIRRNLRHMADYPPGSIGEHVQTGVIAVKESARVGDIGDAIKQWKGDPESPVVILREDSTVAGVLDLMAFLKNHDQGAVAADFLVPIKPVYAEAAQSSLHDRAEWARLTILPVVDHDGQSVGYISRSTFERAHGTVGEGSLLLETGVELSKQFFEFMVYVLVLLFDRRVQR
jgi:Mg/Co/Ni transporter MgtE